MNCKECNLPVNLTDIFKNDFEAQYICALPPYSNSIPISKGDDEVEVARINSILSGLEPSMNDWEWRLVYLSSSGIAGTIAINRRIASIYDGNFDFSKNGKYRTSRCALKKKSGLIKIRAGDGSPSIALVELN